MSLLYRPPSHFPKFFFNEIEKGLDFNSNMYEKFILMGVSNCESIDSVIQDLVYSFGLKNIAKDPTCFKSDDPRCIDLTLTNGKGNFKITTAAETGLSDFHSMILTALKGGFIKMGPRTKAYRDYKSYSPDNLSGGVSTKIEGGIFFRGVQEVFKNCVLLFYVYIASRRHACNGQRPLPKTARIWGRCKKPLNGSRAVPW